MQPLPAIDWQQPWLAPLRARGAKTAARVAAGLSVADALDAAGPLVLQPGGPLRFVPQQSLPPGEAFEAYIHRTACVPTRDNLHDFFSGLIWQQHPALKRRLNAMQAEAIARDGVGPRRGAVRDTLTRFDEHGALLEAPEGLWDALRAADWGTLFVTHRTLWAQARLQIFGHALLEQLATAPRKPLTAFVWAAGDVLAAPAETWGARPLGPLLPLPVLGVPGWWPANEHPDFYADTGVFRPPKPFFAQVRAPAVD